MARSWSSCVSVSTAPATKATPRASAIARIALDDGVLAGPFVRRATTDRSVFTIPIGKRSRWSRDERRVSKPSSTISTPQDRNDSKETSANGIVQERRLGDLDGQARRRDRKPDEQVDHTLGKARHGQLRE